MAENPDLHEFETFEHLSIYLSIPTSENTHVFDSTSINGFDCRILPLNHWSTAFVLRGESTLVFVRTGDPGLVYTLDAGYGEK